MYGYIYKITNRLNGIIYIGKKKSSVFLGKEYMGSGTVISNAIHKYGVDNFDIELIEWSTSLEEQNEQEKYWIKFFRDKNFRLYNISAGGDGGDTVTNQPLERQDEIRKTLRNIQQSRSPEYVQSIVTKRKETIARKNIKLGPKPGHVPWNKGKTRITDFRVAKNAEATAQFYETHPEKRVGRKHTPEAIEKIRQSKIGTQYGLGNRSTKGCKHIHKGTLNTTVPISEIDSYLSQGWELGQYKAPHVCYNSQQVRCVENNTVYDSLTAASMSLNISSYKIKKSIKTQSPVDGLTFVAE